LSEPNYYIPPGHQIPGVGPDIPEGTIVITHNGNRRLEWKEISETVNEPNPPYTPITTWTHRWVQYRRQNDGSWKKHTKHKARWKTIANFCFTISDFDPNRDWAPLRNVALLSLRKYAEAFGDDVLWDLIKEFMKDDPPDAGLKKVWKDTTLAVIRAAIESIPFPIDAVKDWANSLMMAIAEQFYDWLFSL
jgi:hypothetical protein